MARPRILLAESHPGVAEQLRAILEVDGGFEVVAVVTDGFAAVGAAQTLKPEVVVIDIAMPRLPGIAAAIEIVRGSPPPPRVVFVTVHNEPEVVQRAFDVGASGYVMKLTAGEDLVPAVNAALRGDHYASPGVFSSQRSKVTTSTTTTTASATTTTSLGKQTPR
jgi:DNA-binding NarL/FixJ family response regulator